MEKYWRKAGTPCWKVSDDVNDDDNNDNIDDDNDDSKDDDNDDNNDDEDNNDNDVFRGSRKYWDTLTPCTGRPLSAALHAQPDAQVVCSSVLK